jgi:hypothetical protein
MTAGGGDTTTGGAVTPDIHLTRACPRCSEQIAAVATRCRYCLTDLKDDSGSEHWLRSNLAYAVPIATFLYVAFQVFKAADFEVNTAVEVVRESGVSAVFVGVFLVQLPLELLITSLVVSAWLMTTRPAQRNVVLFGLPLIALGVVVSPWLLALFSVLALVAAAVGSARSVRTRKVIAVAELAIAAVLAAYLLSRPTIWVAAEEIETAHHGTVVGYVLSDDGSLTTVLTPTWTHRLPPGQNSLIRMPSGDIRRRSLCAIDFEDAKVAGSAWHVRTYQLLSGWFNHRWIKPLTPPCPPT